jgi:hypothetical protein
MSRRFLAWAVLAAAVMVPARGYAFTTRLHIVLSNDIHDSLLASSDGRSIRLRWSDHDVRLSELDAQAILNAPLAFRAGAIGPDITVFPAMTDGTHALDQNPFRQCEMLYMEAFNDEERAYALGCFLHGSTDAIAHHFVNWFTGETFTLNPVSDDRESSYQNVIGHIVTESTIQSGFYLADPSAFTAAELEHEVPQDFVLRTYFAVDHPIWQRMTLSTRAKWDAAIAADPPSTTGWPRQDLLGWIETADFHPWEHVAMAPQYVNEIQRMRVDLRDYMLDRIDELAADPDIDAQPGPDGRIGTPDDVTACDVSCPAEFGEYWILVHMLAPRQTAGGDPLPSAFDKISDDLGDDLYGFVPALVEVIANLSAFLNSEISDDDDHGLDVPPNVGSLFTPMDDWGSRTFAIDWETAGRAVSPEWYTDLSDFLDMFGVSITIPDILSALFQPIVDQIREALLTQVRDYAETYIEELKREYDLFLAEWSGSVTGDLFGSQPEALDGNALDYAYESGVYAHSFNLTAAVLGNHEVMLVEDMEIANGPASFDASYTPEWSQIGQCSYLREAVFPHGIGLRPLLSVETEGGTYYESPLLDNAPIECHAGSLSEFGPPNATSCAHTTLDELLVTRFGSITRAYPPTYASGDPRCRNLRIPGLPDPPVNPGEDGGMTGDGGNSGFDGGVGDGGMDPVDGGCGCGAVGSNGVSFGWLAILGVVVWRRRRA